MKFHAKALANTRKRNMIKKSKIILLPPRGKSRSPSTQIKKSKQFVCHILTFVFYLCSFDQFPFTPSLNVHFTSKWILCVNFLYLKLVFCPPPSFKIHFRFPFLLCQYLPSQLIWVILKMLHQSRATADFWNHFPTRPWSHKDIIEPYQVEIFKFPLWIIWLTSHDQRASWSTVFFKTVENILFKRW